jgi:putative N-acetylmannosamine-6-phosphate epimerase
MNDITDLNAHATQKRRYGERLAETLKRLDEAAGLLMADLVNLSMFKAWKA